MGLPYHLAREMERKSVADESRVRRNNSKRDEKEPTLFYRLRLLLWQSHQINTGETLRLYSTRHRQERQSLHRQLCRPEDPAREQMLRYSICEHFTSSINREGDCLEKVFKHFGVTLDPQCGNVNRFRYASYDPEPYINENALAFDYVLPSKSEPRTPNTHQRIHSASAPSGSYSEFDLREFLERNNVPYTEKTYNGYVAFEVDCPWADTHTTDSPDHRDKAMVWRDPSNGFCFKCFHTHNNIPKGWKDFRRVVELQSDFGDLHI